MGEFGGGIIIGIFLTVLAITIIVFMFGLQAVPDEFMNHLGEEHCAKHNLSFDEVYTMYDSEVGKDVVFFECEEEEITIEPDASILEHYDSVKVVKKK